MKTLQQVVTAVQYELDCSVSELSRKLGKSRNYLFTHLKNGLSTEKEQKVIDSLLDLVDDENALLRNVVAEQEETITAYREKFKEKNDLIAEKQLFINKLDNERNELWCYKKWAEVEISDLTTKNLLIDGKDKEIKDYNILCNKQQDSIENLKVVCRELGIESQELVKKNRILSLGIIGMAVVCTVALWIN